MSTETNKAIVRRYFEEVNAKGRADLVEEFMTEGIELHGTGLPAGLAAVEQFVTIMDAAFPDRQITIDDLIAEGDRVVAHTTVNATHLGEIQGIPATGKEFTLPSITIFRLANGKIVEGWYAADHLSMMQQLGVIPTPQAV